MTFPGPSAARRGLVTCGTCGLLVRTAYPAEPGFCPRCGARLHLRHPNAIQRTWALVIAAAVCFIPANTLPVMVTNALGSSQPDTILGGVVFLYESGSWPLALIVLVASFTIPLGKLIGLVWLLIAIQRGLQGGETQRMRLHRLVHLVGPWSMLDVFVATFTVSLVQLSPLMSVAPGLGVLFFAAVVVLTMLAAESLDPRLLWDSSGVESPGA